MQSIFMLSLSVERMSDLHIINHPIYHEDNSLSSRVSRLCGAYLKENGSELRFFSTKVKYEIFLLDELKARTGSQVEIVYACGYVGDPIGEYNGVKTSQNLKDDCSADELPC